MEGVTSPYDLRRDEECRTLGARMDHLFSKCLRSTLSLLHAALGVG